MFADRVMPWTERLTVTIKPTWVCNLHCHYCYQGRALPARRKGFMSREVLEAAIRETSLLPVETVDLQWIGGETLAPGLAFFQDALDLTDRYARDGGPELVHWFQTNLTLIDEAWVAFLADHAGRLVLSVSYDFVEDYFLRSQRNGARAARHQWGRIQHAIDLLQARGIRLGCLTTIDRTGLETPPEVWFARWLERDIRRIGLQFDYGDVYSHRDSGEAGDPWRPYIEFLDAIFALQAAHNARHPERPVELRESVYLFNKIAGLRDNDWTTSCHHSRSLCGQFFWTIDMDGTVYAMCDAFLTEEVAARYRLGHVGDGNLAALKDSPVFADLTARQFALKHAPACRACSAYRYCRGGCPAFKSEGNLLEAFSPGSVYCAYTRALFGRFLDDPAGRARILAVYPHKEAGAAQPPG